MVNPESSQRVLVVEDDPLTGADLVSTLSQLGYDAVGPLATGEEVVKSIVSLSPNLVLMDINLAGKLDGIQTASQIQDLFPAPIVFLTGLNDEVTLQRAKLANVFGYLIKPFDGLELRSNIELTLHRFRENGHVRPGKLAPVDSDTEFSVPSESAPTAEQCEQFLGQLPFLKGISPAAIRELAQHCSIREHDAGDFLVQEGVESSAVFIPLSGRISVTKTAESGRELIVALLAPGDPFGLFFSLAPFANSSSARTQVASRIIWIRTEDWKEFSSKNSQISTTLNLILAEHLTAAHALSSSLAHARVEDRIVKTLIALLPNFGKSVANKANEGRIFLTRKELAELTGTTPETAIRMTKNLERDGLLDLTRPGIIKIVDLSGLRQLAV